MGRWKLRILWTCFCLLNINGQISTSRVIQQRWRRQAEVPIGPKLPNITFSDLISAVSQGAAVVNNRFNELNTAIYNEGIQHDAASPEWFMAVSHRDNPISRNISVVSLISEETTRIIAQRYGLSRKQIAYSLPNLDIRKSQLSDECSLQVDFPCQPRIYRSYSGHCNNVQHPKWGTANTRYLRYLMPNYADGVSSPRTSTNQTALPSPRVVSLSVHRDSDRPHAHLMALTSIWGEFIFHDLAHTPQMSGYQGNPIKCCGVQKERLHPECFPIQLPTDDPYYQQLANPCQEYVRSSVAPRVGCTLGPREQINQVSSFLDASQIYGNSKSKVEELRLFQGGMLITQIGLDGELLPSDSKIKYCRPNPSNLRCFKAGDDRVNEHLGLTSLHTLWVREHNRVARELSKVNSHWSDDILFQEARRVIAAEIQHITYKEFVPIVLGESIVTNYDLKLQATGYFPGYDININSGIMNGVATAALWFFTSLMPNSIGMFNENGHKITEKSIQDSFYAPFDLYHQGVFDQLLRGFLRSKAQSEDQFINNIMTNKMFEYPLGGLGLDLAAQLIQQGRDHGVPGYIYYRELCGLKKPTTFEDLHGDMSENVVRTFHRLYNSVDEIDLFTGGLSEYPLEGAVVGPTFGCLLAVQFQKLRNGDRFWYENDLPPSAFTFDQLQEIRKVTLARIICDNSNAMKEVQPNVLLGGDPFLNAPMHCAGDAIRKIDFQKWHSELPRSTIPTFEVLEAIRRARFDVSQLHTQEKDLWTQRRNIDPRSPGGTAFGFNKPKAQALEIANTSFLLQFATSRFLSGVVSQNSAELQDSEGSSGFNREIREILNELPNIDISTLTELPKNQKCGEHDLPCDHTSIFRSITGWCNNIQIANKGKAFTPFKRLLLPEYHDGLQIPRMLSLSRTPLPSARLVSTEIHGDISIPHQRNTLLVMQYAQLLDHDLTHTPMNKGFGSSILDCHSCNAKETIHPECWPISVPDGDPHFPAVNITTGERNCLSFTRSLPGQLTLGFREQLNQVTSYIDASHTYGSDICEAKKLRLLTDGQMNVTQHPAGSKYKNLLPQTPSHPECKAPSGLCFEAGDLRVSEQPGLVAIHTIWLREHNRLALELKAINPHWQDELLYQHSRRILSAVTQHITYAEWLPRILGWDHIFLYNLELEPDNYYQNYNVSCDATIFNEFAAAAFRFGHSLLRPSFRRVTSSLKVRKPSVQLRHTFFNPDLLFQPGMVDEIMFGLVNTPMETLDNFITDEVTNHLFENRKSPVSGMDLAALNIQRGRDHGIQPYNAYRTMCNLTRAKTFNDLAGEIDLRLIEKLQKLYPSVDDIDLFPGGLAESSVHGGLVGPTFACIIGKQFQLLRRCDRFWYENAEPLTRFTLSQLAEIRKSSMSRLMCDNGDDIPKIQRSAFDVPGSFLNPQVPCNSLPKINLDAWKDRTACKIHGKVIEVGSAQRVSPCVMCTCTKEGSLCQSMKIENCFHLRKSFTPFEILRDNVCKVQCAFQFRIFSLNFENVDYSS